MSAHEPIWVSYLTFFTPSSQQPPSPSIDVPWVLMNPHLPAGFFGVFAALAAALSSFSFWSCAFFFFLSIREYPCSIGKIFLSKNLLEFFARLASQRTVQLTISEYSWWSVIVLTSLPKSRRGARFLWWYSLVICATYYLWVLMSIQEYLCILFSSPKQGQDRSTNHYVLIIII